jgi:hypothetical protein
MQRAFTLLDTNQWNVLLDEIQKGILNVNEVNAQGQSLLVYAFMGTASSLVPSLLRLGADPNFVFQMEGIPLTLVDLTVLNGALKVPRQQLRGYQDIVDTLGYRLQYGN